MLLERPCGAEPVSATSGSLRSLVLASGALDRKSSRRCTDAADWLEAHRIADEYEKAGSWTGNPNVLSPAPEPALEKPRVTTADAIN